MTKQFLIPGVRTGAETIELPAQTRAFRLLAAYGVFVNGEAVDVLPILRLRWAGLCTVAEFTTTHLGPTQTGRISWTSDMTAPFSNDSQTIDGIQYYLGPAPSWIHDSQTTIQIVLQAGTVLSTMDELSFLVDQQLL